MLFCTHINVLLQIKVVQEGVFFPEMLKVQIIKCSRYFRSIFYHLIYHKCYVIIFLKIPFHCLSDVPQPGFFGGNVHTLRSCPLGLLEQLFVTYMLYSNALLRLYYVFTLGSCDRH